MKQIGAKIHSKVFCLQRSLRTFSPSFQLAKLDEYNHNEPFSDKSSDDDSQILKIPDIDELTDYPSIDLSSFGLVDDPGIASPGELNDNFEFLLDKILAEFENVDVVEMPERLMKMRQWKPKENLDLYHIILPLIRTAFVNTKSSPNVELFFMDSPSENSKIEKLNSLRSSLRPRQAQQHKSLVRTRIELLKNLDDYRFNQFRKPIHLPLAQRNYEKIPSQMDFENRLRDILELLDSPVDLNSYLNYPEPSLENSDSFFFDEWESWYQKMLNLIMKLDSYTGGDPDFDLIADRSILVDFLWPKDSSTPIPDIPMKDVYKNGFLVPFFEFVGPVEKNLPSNITNSFTRLTDRLEPDYSMIVIQPEISIHMGRDFQNTTGKILVV